jgi:hypothetical protein
LRLTKSRKDVYRVVRRGVKGISFPHLRKCVAHAARGAFDDGALLFPPRRLVGVDTRHGNNHSLLLLAFGDGLDVVEDAVSRPQRDFVLAKVVKE